MFDSLAPVLNVLVVAYLVYYAVIRFREVKATREGTRAKCVRCRTPFEKAAGSGGPYVCGVCRAREGH